MGRKRYLSRKKTIGGFRSIDARGGWPKKMFASTFRKAYRMAANLARKDKIPRSDIAISRNPDTLWPAKKGYWGYSIKVKPKNKR